MPMYEYRCRTCGQGFEELVRGPADEAELCCPACGADEPKRCLSACAVRVGGGDFAGSDQPFGSSVSGMSGMAGGCGGGGFS